MIPIPRSLAYNEVILPSGVVSGVFATGNYTGAHGAVYERPEDGAEHDPAHERVQKNREGDEKAAQKDVWFHESPEGPQYQKAAAGARSHLPVRLTGYRRHVSKSFHRFTRVRSLPLPMSCVAPRYCTLVPPMNFGASAGRLTAMYFVSRYSSMPS